MMRGPARRLGCWPTAEQDLLLRAALLDGAAVRNAWEQWRCGVDIQRLDEGSFRLLPLAWENLQCCGGLPSSSTDPLLALIRGVHRQSWYRNQLLFREVAAVVQQLESAGVRTALLKGVPLAMLYYRSDAARPMSDADVLVHPRDVTRAVSVLRAAGWRPDVEPPAWPPEPRGSWSFRNDDGYELDLHWRVLELPGSIDNASWDGTVSLDVRGTRTRSLGATDLLLHVLVHGLKWNPIPSIRWVADGATIIRVAGNALDWDRLVRRTSSLQMAPAVALGLSYLEHKLAVVIPSAVSSRLAHDSRSMGGRIALWSRMAPGVTGATCRLWFEYRGAARNVGRRAGVFDFPEFVRRRLMIPQERSLARALGARLLLRGRR